MGLISEQLADASDPSVEPPRRIGHGSERWFPLLWAIGAALFIIILHLGKGTELGFAASPKLDGKFPVGFLFDAADNLSYASWSQQAKQGWLLAKLSYTTTPNSRVYLNWLFFLIGVLSRFTGLPVPGLLNLSGVIGTAVAIAMTYAIAISSGLPPRSARWALFFLCLASGMSAISGLVCRVFHVAAQPWMGADVRNLQAFGLPTFAVFPYQAFVLGWLAITMWLVLASEIEEPSKWRLAILAGSNLMLGTVHPYESPVLTVSYALYAICSIGNRDLLGSRRIKICLALVAAMLPGAAYSLWLARQPLWMQFAQASTHLGVMWTRRFWIIGFGATLPLALLGCYGVLRDDRYSKARWIAIWVALVLAALVILDVSNVKIADGLPIPIAIMSGLGLTRLFDLASSLEGLRLRRLVQVALVALILSLPTSNISLCYYTFRADEISGDLWRVLGGIEFHSTGRNILASTSVGAVAPGLIGASVFAGHWTLTPDFNDKIESLKAAGFEGGDATGSAPDRFDRLVDTSRAQWVVTRSETPAELFASRDSLLQEVQTAGDWHLYVLARSPR